MQGGIDTNDAIGESADVEGRSIDTKFLYHVVFYTKVKDGFVK